MGSYHGEFMQQYAWAEAMADDLSAEKEKA